MFVLHLASNTSKVDPYATGLRATDTCPSGYQPITTAAECEGAAASLGMQYDQAGAWSGSPAGCLTSQWDGRGVYFNSDAIGAVHPDQAPICKKVDTTCEYWSVEYNGKCYAVLPKTPPGTGTPSSEAGACHSDFLPLPAGYQLVDYSDDIQTNVASQHQFGTWRVVYSNGKAYGTGSNGNCGRCDCTYCDVDGLLTEDNGQYKVSDCSSWSQVFIVKDMSQTALTWQTYGPGKKGCSGEGQDLAGNNPKNLAGCQDLCLATDTCNAFAWNSANNKCYIKMKDDVCTDEACDWNRDDNDDADWNWYYYGCPETWNAFEVIVWTNPCKVPKSIVALITGF